MISIQSQQILVPKSVYIGDTAELQCSFNFNSPQLLELTQQGEINLPLEKFTEPLNFQEYEIKSVTLSPAGVDFYQLTVTFIPWKTGEIKFPSFQLDEYTIEFEPITIVSITEQNSITALRETTAPLLLPGTTYKFYAFLIFCVAFFILLVRGIIRHKQVMFFIKNQQLKFKYKKNSKMTRKKLSALLTKDKEFSSKQLASEIQNIMRHYLEVRLAYPFTKVVTSEMMNGYYAANSGLQSEEKEIAFGEFVSVFVRTDFIRYSNQADFEQSERAEIIQKLIKNIEVIEISGGENV